MAHGESIDPLEFSKEDILMGAPRVEKDPDGLIPHYDVKGMKRWRRKGRLVGNGRDRILMAQMKSGMASLWADGHSYQHIAESISDHYGLEGDERMKPNLIKYHIKQMLDYWRQKGLALLDERQAIILARFDQIEALAIEGYFASMEGKDTTQKHKQIIRAGDNKKVKQRLEAERDKRGEKKTRAPMFIDTGELVEDIESLLVVAEKVDKHKKHETNRAGDPKFLAIITNVNIQRAKILGLYNKKETMDSNSEAAKLSDEQREQRLATILSAARERRQKTATMLAEPAPLVKRFGLEEEDVPEATEEVVDDPPEEVGWGFTDTEEVSVPDPNEIVWD